MSGFDGLRAVNLPQRGTGLVEIAYLHPGEVSECFHASLVETITHDALGRCRLQHPDRAGLSATISGAGRLATGRNQAVRRFLDGSAAEWLCFIDADMGWEADAIDRLLDTADPDDAPVVGALCFGLRKAGTGPSNAMRSAPFPTLYSWHEGFDCVYEWDRGQVVTVDGTGAAFLLTHRSVLEDIRTEDGDVWFDNLPQPGGEPGDWMGEDLSFCYRLHQRHISVKVDTSVVASHHKGGFWIDEAFYDQQRTSRSPAVSVVIPVRDNIEMTQRLVGQLYSFGGYDDLLIFDNGSEDPAMRSWLERIGANGMARVFDASEAEGIHAMWNAGIAEARRLHPGGVDVALLNNDLLVGHGFLQRLSRGLREDPSCLAVCGNYDNRPGRGTIPVRGIAAGRYDGTGGLAGFAFMVRSELLERYRFPTEMAWFFGDNHLVASIEAAGGWYGVVQDALVDHLDGGGNTTTAGRGPTAGQGWFESLSPRMQEAYRHDEATFAAMLGQEAAA